MLATPISRFTYRAFISYSHADKTWADWLHKALETYRIPSRLVGTETSIGSIPRRLNPIFRDRDELASAHDLGRKVNEALAQSANLIVICSPASATSHWVNEEILAYKRMGRAERIFCLIVGGEPNASDLPGRESEECFAPALRFHFDENGQPTTERTEPIAADASPGKDGKSNAKLKLIAGMLDVGFDALKQREQHRKMRRMAVVTASALVVMAITIVLASFALISRHDAVIAQQAAQRRQKQAEDLVGFMLGDLNDKLAQVNRLDIMQSVDDKAMAYFQSLPDTDVTPEALAQRAKALEKIGTVRMDQGLLPAALQAFDASARISSRLAAEQRADATRQVAYARTLSFIGFTYWDQGNLAEAQRNFQTAKEVLERAQTQAHSNLPLKFELALVLNNIGHVLEVRGQLDQATLAYRNMLTLMQELVRAAPDNTDYPPYLGTAFDNLGKMALFRGDLAESIGRYRAEDAIETGLLARNPEDNNQRENMMSARAILGRTLALAGEGAASRRDLQQAVEIASRLIHIDASQISLQERLGLYSTQLARLQRLNGALPAAQSLTAHSIAILRALAQKDPTNHIGQSYYAGALTEQAAESLDANQPRAAHDQAQRALQILEPMLAKHPDDRDTLIATMTARLLSAETDSDPQTAGSQREQTLHTLHAVKVNRGDPRLLALQVEALLALGRKAEAQPLIKQLWVDGYRDQALLDVLRREHIEYPINTEFAQRLATIMKSTQTDAARLPAAAGDTKRPATHR